MTEFHQTFLSCLIAKFNNNNEISYKSTQQFLYIPIAVLIYVRECDKNNDYNNDNNNDNIYNNNNNIYSGF